MKRAVVSSVALASLGFLCACAAGHGGATARTVGAPGTLGDSQESSTAKAWRGLAEKTQKLTGSINYVLGAGQWESHAADPNDSLVWTAAASTKFRLERQGDAAQTTTLTVDPPIHVRLAVHPHTGGMLSKVDLSPSEPIYNMSLSFLAEILPWERSRLLAGLTSSLKVSDYRQALTGFPFDGFRAAAGPLDVAPPISSGVTVFGTDSVEKGVGISVSGFTIAFGDDAQPSAFDVSSSEPIDLVLGFNYNPPASTLDADIQGLHCHTCSGGISTNGLASTFASSALVTLDNVRLSGSLRDGGTITALGGHLVGNLSGVKISSGDSAAPLASGATARVDGVLARVQQRDGVDASLEFGPGLMVTLPDAEAHLRIGQSDLAAHASAITLIAAHATFHRIARPDVAGRLSGSLAGIHGSIKVGSALVPIVSGTMAFQNLRFDTSVPNSLSGTLDHLALYVPVGTSLSLSPFIGFDTSNVLEIAARGGGSLSIPETGSGVAGTFAPLIGTFKQLNIGRTRAFVVTDGRFAVPLETNSDGNATIRDAHFSGAIVGALGHNRVHARVDDLPVVLATGETTPTFGNPTIGWDPIDDSSGPQTFTPPLKNSVWEDGWAYPVHYSTAVHCPAAHFPIVFSAGGDSFQASGAVSCQMTISIPEGHGQYIDPDHPENGTNDGHGKDDALQETLAIKGYRIFPVPSSCIRHEYLFAQSYQASLRLSINFQGAGFTSTVSDVDVPDFDFDPDGCADWTLSSATFGFAFFRRIFRDGVKSLISGWQPANAR